MLLILVALIAAIAGGFLLCKVGNDGNSFGHILLMFFGVCLLLCSSVSALACVYAGWNWIASDYQAQIINREYGTHYTRAEVFYASDVIDTIRQLDRKRVEVDGDLFRDKPEPKK